MTDHPESSETFLTHFFPLGGTLTSRCSSNRWIPLSMTPDLFSFTVFQPLHLVSQGSLLPGNHRLHRFPSPPCSVVTNHPSHLGLSSTSQYISPSPQIRDLLSIRLTVHEGTGDNLESYHPKNRPRLDSGLPSLPPSVYFPTIPLP